MLHQPGSQGLSSLPPLVAETETLVAAGHVTTQNLGGTKICWKGGVFCRPLDQMYLSTHPPCGFGWIDGHVTSRHQALCSNDQGRQRGDTLGTRLMLHKPIRVCLNEWENRFEFSLQSIYGLFGWTETPCWISSSVSTTVCFGFILKIFPVLDAIFDFCLSKQSIDALQRNIKPILLLVSVNANFEFVINPRGGANMYWRLHFVIH